MELINTSLGALLAGLVSSVHCVGMCGPLACGLAAMPASETERLLAMSAYHAARLAAYALIGGLCGWIGRQPLEWVFGSPAALLPWVLVVVFLIFGFGLEKKLPRPPVLLKWSARMRFRLGRLSPVRGGLGLGLLTPLLPCGPLYLLFGASLISGSSLRGAEFAFAFGLGTLPLLWLAQQQLAHFRKCLKPATLIRLQRSFAITAACLIAFRLWDTLPITESHHAEPKPLPSCCH